MPALQVREFPLQLYDELRERAAQDNRSIAQQTVVAVREHLHPLMPGATQQLRDFTSPTLRLDHRRRYFERLDAYAPVTIPDDFPSPEEIVRNLRDER